MTTPKTNKIPTPKMPNTRAKNATSASIPKKSQTPSVKKATNKNTITKKTIIKTSLPVPPSRQTTLQKKRTNTSSGLWFFVKVIVVILLWIVVWTQKDMFLSMIGLSHEDKLIINQDDDVLFVGKSITTEWIIQKASSRKYNYTHTIEDTNYGVLWLRSTTIDLNALSGTTKLEWQVIDFVNNIYIVEITNAEMLSKDKETQSSLLYFARPWILIQDMSAQWFSITNQESSTTSTISIANSTTKAQVNIRYFSCSNDQAYDCKRFQDTFENTVGVHFVDSYNNRFYKLKDANTWFVNLENKYGVYIETSNEALLTMIIPNIQFITSQWAKATLWQVAQTLCNGSGYQIQEVINGTISQEGWNIIRNLQGTSQNYEPIECKLSINPLAISTSTLISITKKQWNTVVVTTSATAPQSSPQALPSVEEKPTQTNNLSLTNNNVEQIPLKPGKELSFSTRGINISFPSPNISFASTNINKTVQGLSCTTATNIVLYANKTNLTTNPSVVMYFCKPGITETGNNFRVMNTANTTILIELLDPAWVNFINWITING